MPQIIFTHESSLFLVRIRNILSIQLILLFFLTHLLSHSLPPQHVKRDDSYSVSSQLNNLKYCLYQPYEPGDDWTEHISSSGKKYYYNCRTEVSQWEKPKEWLER